MASPANQLIGLLCIVGGGVMIMFALGDLLMRFLVGLMALALINYGLRLRGLPPLQLLIPLMVSRHGRRWF
jgi:hypothetical protein